jgi:hypothetical protein
MAPTAEKERKTLDDCDTTGFPGTLVGNRSNQAGPKEGSDVAVEEWHE